ncbi:MAG TPA: hypothetical protein VM557_11815 [Thermoanaerobaculia bacterium]|nr:hypothetical protein [Thermoanaerobaculia bacterium]
MQVRDRSGEIADRSDRVAAHADVRANGGRAGAVENLAPRDDERAEMTSLIASG